MTIFNLHDFVMKTLKGMSKEYSEFQVREYALNWYSKGTLVDDDMIEIESWYTVNEIDLSENDFDPDTINLLTEQ